MTGPVTKTGARLLALPPEATSAQQAARQFEAVFLGQMVQMASEGLESDGAFSGGHGEEMFQSILAENLGREMSRAGDVGLSAAVARTLTHLQEQK